MFLNVIYSHIQHYHHDYKFDELQIGEDEESMHFKAIVYCMI